MDLSRAPFYAHVMKSEDSMYKPASYNFSERWDLCPTLHFLGVQDPDLNVSKITRAGQTNTLSVATQMQMLRWIFVYLSVLQSWHRIVFHADIWTGRAACAATRANEPAPAKELGQILIMLIVVAGITLVQVVTDFPKIFS